MNVLKGLTLSKISHVQKDKHLIISHGFRSGIQSLQTYYTSGDKNIGYKKFTVLWWRSCLKFSVRMIKFSKIIIQYADEVNNKLLYAFECF